MAITSYVAAHSSELALYAALLLVSYKITVYVQRLYFHPLSAFPGPKICAASRIYEFYWDSVQKGRLWKRLPELHKQYGPIIRMGPDELHIQDPEYFNYLFGFKPLHKHAMTGKQFGLVHAMWATEDPKLHAQRRAAFGDGFSRSKALRIEPMIVEKINRGCDWIRQQQQPKKDMPDGGTADLAFAFRAIPAEIMTEYMYGQQYGFFEDETTTRGLYDRRFDAVLGLTHLGRFIPFWIPILITLARSKIRGLFGVNESTAAFMNFLSFAEGLIRNVLAEQKTEQSISGNSDGDKSKNQPVSSSSASDAAGAPINIKEDLTVDKEYNSLIETFVHSSLPPGEKDMAHLTQATMAAWSGGWDTTGFALTLCLYRVLENPAIERRLAAELVAAWPDPSADPVYVSSSSSSSSSPTSMTPLDELPYLAAVVKETLRHMHGALSRITRVNPDAPEAYAGWSIPAGTKISMSLPDMHLDAGIWGKDVNEFRPERWLVGEEERDTPSSSSSGGSNDDPSRQPEPEPKLNAHLDRFLVAFSRGARNCAGWELAVLELKLIVAAAVRRFHLRVDPAAGVTDDDVVAYSDGFTPGPRNWQQRLPVFAVPRA